MNKDNILNLPSILDRAILNEDEDKFGHAHYAHALFSIIENHKDKAPFSIGLLGQWGVGKSSIKQICINKFLNANQDKFEVLDFNAWRYESEDIRRSLLKFLHSKLSNEKEEDLRQRLYSNITDMFKKEKSWREYIVEIIDKYLWIPGQIICIVLVLAWLAIQINRIFSFGLVDGPLVYSVFAICATAIIKYAFNVNGFIVSKYTDRVVMTPPIISSEQFEDEILDILKNKKKGKIAKDKKIVIFIDDLDRLAPEKMIKGLDAIRVFLDIPESNFIFIVSCYDEHIAKSISQTKTTFSDIESARKYLDRVFQFKIDIPVLPNQSMKNFALEHLNKLDTKNLFKEDIKKSITYDLDKILNILIPIEINSPRAVIQILNSYMQAWWLAKKREEKCNLCNKEDNNSCPTNEECLLVKDIISSRLDILAIITVIKNQFPELYNDISLEPQFLSFILCKFLELKNCEVIENSQYKYLAEKYKEEGLENYIFAKKYANLQSYLSSIQNISIPEDIKPFIMLLQDPLEREIGGNSVSIYNSLITQNTQKFKDLLGINENTHNLSESQILQLNLVLQSINRNEDKDRLEKAYLLLSKFIDLYCCDKARLLVNDIAKVLVDKDFIQHLGTTDIRKLLNSEYISNENINKLYLFLLSRINQSKPILKEDSAAIFKEIIQIGLGLHYNNKKLDDSISKSLLKIFNDGKYKYISDENKIIKEEKIDILFYIENIKTYGESLLSDLNLDYILDLLEFLNNNNNDNDIETYISQIDFILHHNKVNKKGLVESILNNGIANNQPLIVDYFEKLLLEENLVEKINLALVSEIIDSFVQRIIKHYSGKHTLNDIKNKILNLIKILDNYKYNITDIIESNMSTLLIILSKINVKLFDELFTKYQQIFIKKSTIVINQIIENVFVKEEQEESISKELLILLAQKYIKEEQFKILSEQINVLFEDYTVSISKEDSEKYYLLLSNLNEEFYHNKLFVEHISRMYESLEMSIRRNYDEYFEILFKTIARFFNIIKTPTLNSLLSYMIVNHLAIETKKTEKLYQLMNGLWPLEDKDLLKDYDVINIVENAHKLIENSKTLVSKLDIFKSIYSIKINDTAKANQIKNKYVNSLMFLWKNNTDYAYYELLNLKEFFLTGYKWEWISPQTPDNKVNLLENLWKELFAIADDINIQKRTINYLKEFPNDTNLTIWLMVMYSHYNNFNILNNAIAILLTECNDKLIQDCMDIANYIIKNHENEKEVYAKTLFYGYIQLTNVDYKKSILSIMKKLLSPEAKGFFSKTDFKNSKDVKQDVDKLQKAFKKNKSLQLFRKELFSRKKQKQSKLK